MKAIVEHYAKGEFQVDRPEVAISEKFLKLNIESGTLYEGVFTVNSTNDHVIKAMVYDSRYMLRFNQHTFIAKNFDVGFTFDATCLEAGKNYKGHISVITDGGEFKILYDIDITTPYVKYGDQKIDDLFKFATLAESNWAEAARVFVRDDFKRTFINPAPRFVNCGFLYIWCTLVEQTITQIINNFLAQIGHIISIWRIMSI